MDAQVSSVGVGQVVGGGVLGGLDVPVYEAMKKASEALLSSRRLSEAWQRWEAYLEDVWQERAQEAQELAKQQLEEAAREMQGKADAEAERRVELCKRVIF